MLSVCLRKIIITELCRMDVSSGRRKLHNNMALQCYDTRSAGDGSLPASVRIWMIAFVSGIC